MQTQEIKTTIQPAPRQRSHPEKSKYWDIKQDALLDSLDADTKKLAEWIEPFSWEERAIYFNNLLASDTDRGFKMAEAFGTNQLAMNKMVYECWRGCLAETLKLLKDTKEMDDHKALLFWVSQKEPYLGKSEEHFINSDKLTLILNTYEAIAGGFRMWAHILIALTSPGKNIPLALNCEVHQEN